MEAFVSLFLLFEKKNAANFATAGEQTQKGRKMSNA
jgi:hypothetical protein